MSDALRLFLVEADDEVAARIGESLMRAGHGVTRCRTAADALIVLGHNAYDLVLLDSRLSDMAGLDLLKALAREGITTPALMVTGSGDEQLATNALHAGALDYVVRDPASAFLKDLPKHVHESVTRHRLQHMNRLLIEAFESARDGIMITDLQGTILHVNHALEAMTGYTRTELQGQNPRLLKSETTPAEVFSDLWRTILARGSWQGEVTNRRKDGSLSHVSLTVSPIVDLQGQLTHFVGIQRDISDRKLLEGQLLQAQKMQSVGTLAGGVAHEFNNLLAGISGYASLGLREPQAGEPVRELLQHIVQLAERAAGLTRQMLAYARKPALARQTIRIQDLLEATADLVRRTMHTPVEVELQPPPDSMELYVEADANQLQQALINLALNARDARTDGSAIRMCLGQATLYGSRPAFPENVPPGDYVVIEVIDRGQGMPQEVLNQALDPFFTTKPVGQGTGLGLSVVFGIVRGHQGYLTIQSKPGVGTNIGIYLPRIGQRGPAPAASRFEPGQVLEPEGVPGRHILVLDDEEAVRDVVRRFLEIAGHRVTCAATANSAMTSLAGEPPVDLVVLDLLLPDDDGAGTFEKLREQHPLLPILLCTGLIDEQVPDIARSGKTRILRKPFRMNELWYAVNQSLA